MTTSRTQILNLLCDRDEPISGPTLADTLSISRAGVWKQIEALRTEGFDIPSTDAGYVLASIPETGAAALELGLDAPFSIEYHDAIDSTNRRARELAESGVEETAVVAAEQTAGRGRLDREWESPPGGIYCSLLCRPSLAPVEAPLFTLAAAVATTETLDTLGCEGSIKWPNDVLVGESERKIAGILTEMQGETDRIDWMVVGIGINVETPPIDEATGLNDEIDGTVDRRAVVQGFIERFDHLRSAPERILPAWREHTATLGRDVRVETPEGSVVGTATEIVSPGALLVETDSGTKRIHAGDCEHLRPISAGR
ncbi:biotin--[acetyl-CoA-carboxylase] ligase [Halocatena halophila]|uniref:biotin--[acetyl-CoA-carboxylase] ligase n=1 Tax=Halocatena halophila TaxID=2814576 RepID=UPI002ED26269